MLVGAESQAFELLA